MPEIRPDSAQVSDIDAVLLSQMVALFAAIRLCTDEQRAAHWLADLGLSTPSLCRAVENRMRAAGLL